MKKSYFLVYLILFTLFCSCGSNKNISYFQDLEKYEYLKGEIIKSDSINIPRIKSNDELVILVSSIEPQAVIPFNLPSVQGKPSTYFVDNEGDINFPTLGKIRLSGLTVQQATGIIQNKLEEFIYNPIVNVQIQNFRVSVLGAVNSPGPFYVGSGRVSILDAIANARDLTLHARRDNVLLIRENGNKKEFVRFDLTRSNDVFSSEYFYLQQNDIIYVEPNKELQKDAGMSQQKQFNLTLITTGITALISAISLIVAVSKN